MKYQQQRQTRTTKANSQQRVSRNIQPPLHPLEELSSAIGNRAMGRLIQQAEQIRQESEASGQPLNCSPLLRSIIAYSQQQSIQRKPLFRGLSHELMKELQQQGTPVQTKLTLGEPRDQYEREADAIARQVVSEINSPTQTEKSFQRIPRPQSQRLSQINNDTNQTDLSNIYNSDVPNLQRMVITEGKPWQFIKPTGSSKLNNYDAAVQSKNTDLLLKYHTQALRKAKQFIPHIENYIDTNLSDREGKDVVILQGLHPDLRDVQQYLVPEEKVHMTIELRKLLPKKSSEQYHVLFEWNESAAKWICTGAYGTNLTGAKQAGTRQDFADKSKREAYYKQLKVKAENNEPGAQELLNLWESQAQQREMMDVDQEIEEPSGEETNQQPMPKLQVADPNWLMETYISLASRNNVNGLYQLGEMILSNYDEEPKMQRAYDNYLSKIYDKILELVSSNNWQQNLYWANLLKKFLRI